MPTPTNPTPAEIAALEREIAERVMEKRVYDYGVCGTSLDGWSPWNDERAALAVLKRLEEITNKHLTIEHLSCTWIVVLSNDEDYDGIFYDAQAPGPHFGPAVCLLARKVGEGGDVE